MTDLFLFRHAAAGPADLADLDRFGADGADARRGLTRRGRRRFRRFARALGDDGVRFDLLLHSPWRRAVETAELLTPLTTGRTEVTGALAMAPGPELDAALTGTGVAVVGHEPWLSALLARLTGAPEGLIRWRKGGLVWLRRDDDQAPWRIRAARGPRGAA